MKHLVSLVVCVLITISLVTYRVAYSDMVPGNPPLKVTLWDAFGYYAYLPAIFKYHDIRQLQWLTAIDAKYAVTGGNGWQAQRQDNGNYVFKYLGGVAIMEIPFYFVGDWMAKLGHYPRDGFSPPYQYALGFGVILYCILALFLLRRVLLVYFSDQAVALTLLLLTLATNFVQYVSVDNGQSHAYIFPLYVLILYATIRWHQRPSLGWAIVMGYIVGLASVSRPTEAIMLFIPIFWNTQARQEAKIKWQQVRQHKSHIVWAGLFVFLAVLPQLVYWKLTAGSFIYDVGSKWEFLSPHFRVLFGWEKGWFIYTPVTVLFIAGMFFMKNKPFRKSALWFCLLNIYIIIAWHDWRYGGSYSARALVQSYPVFALPFAALVERVTAGKWRLLFYGLCAYLLFVNVFQIWQYNNNILHYDDMNRKYYAGIYLNSHPSPRVMSLLDDNETLTNEKGFDHKTLFIMDTATRVHIPASGVAVLRQVSGNTASAEIEKWLRIDATIDAPGCLWQSYLVGELKAGDSIKRTKVRLFTATSNKVHDYSFYMCVPDYFRLAPFKLYIYSAFDFTGIVSRVSITELDR